MKKTYSNASKALPPDLKKILMWLLIALSIGFFALDFWSPFTNENIKDIFLIAAYVCLILIYVLFFTQSQYAVVDYDAGTMTTNETKKPIQISDIDRIMKHCNKNGKLKYINIHEIGVRFVTLRLRISVLEKLVQDLKSINPDIMVKDVNY